MRNYIFIGLVFFTTACSNPTVTDDQSVVKVEVTKKPVEFDEMGQPTKFEVYSMENGVDMLVGLEEVYGTGQVKMKGGINSKGERNGLWEAFYEDGTNWSIGNYQNGKETGQKKVWYPNGKLRYQGLMKNDDPIGKWEFWDPTGKLSEKIYE